MKKITLAFALLTLQVSLAQNSCATASTINYTSLLAQINPSGQLPPTVCSGTAAATPARWYKYTPTENVVVTLTSDIESNANRDSRISVFTGNCNNLVCYASDDNSGNLGSGLLSKVSFEVMPGTTYYFAIESLSADTGIYFQLYKERYPATPVIFTSQQTANTSSVCCVVDMNGDYLDDIVYTQNNTMVVMSQNADGIFTPNYVSLPNLATTPGWSIAAGDFDRNGYNDLVFGGGSRLSVIRANNDGTTFTEVKYPQSIFTQRTNFIDINNDGNLDLFACHDVAQSHAYRNDGNGNLIFDISLFPTLAVGGNYASIWTDYDNDGDQDMYLAKCRGGAPAGDQQRINLLYRNNGDGTFTEAGSMAGVNDGAQSWSTAVEDFDNDGDMDFLLSNISDNNRFYRNNGNGTFTDVYASTGIATQVGSWEVQTADFNNDGFVDFLWENGKQLYLNNGNLTFTGYNLIFTEGAIGDLNNDGFLDVQNQNKIYFNTPNGNNWVKINLQGNDSNRNGIGARVEIYGVWGKQIRDIRSGTGFAHQSSLNAHFGIGQATTIDRIIIKWPSGTVDVVENPDINQSVFVEEGTRLSVSENQNSMFSLYPNPAKEKLHFTLKQEQEIVEAKIFDLNGKQVAQPKYENNTIEVQNLASGNYILVLKNADGNKSSQKFIKK